MRQERIRAIVRAIVREGKTEMAKQGRIRARAIVREKKTEANNGVNPVLWEGVWVLV